MADYTEYEEQGWFSRIKESIKGVAVGGLLFLLAFPLLFWNEGRAVDRARDLEIGQGQVVEASADQADPAKEGKLIHVYGNVKGDGPLVDSDLGVSTEAIKLFRTVEMYQWVENVKETTEKQTGGKKVTKKEYTYELEWKEGLVDSSGFKLKKNKDGVRMVNPAGMPFESRDLVASRVTLGAYELSSPFINQLNQSKALDLTGPSAPKLPREYAQAVVRDGTLYLDGEPGSPNVGDVRVRYNVVLPADATVVGKQVGTRIDSFQSPEMTSAVNELRYGKLSPAEVFAAAQADNVTMTWILRLVGFLMLFIGLSMFFKPLAVIADFFPLFGSIVQAGTTLIAGVISVPLALTTIGVAWVFYRPLVGIPLAIVGVGGIVGAIILAKKRGAAKAGQPVVAAQADSLKKVA